MKKTLKLFSTALILFLFAMSFSASLAFETSGDWTYTTEGTLVSYDGDNTVIEIPSQLGGTTITSLNSYMFSYNTTVTEIIVPDSITELSIGAFSGCTNLVSLTLPESLILGDTCFYNCKSLENLYYPGHSVTLSDDFIIIDNVLEFYRGSSAVVTVPSGVTTIGAYAFYGNINVTSVTLPEGLTSIEVWAFRETTKLTTVSLPSTLTIIGAYSFYESSALTTMVIPASVTTIENYAFYECNALSSLTLNEGLVTIGFKAFCGCRGLTSLELPSTIRELQSGCFSFCTYITDIVIPEGITELPYQAFYCCIRLENITVPSTMTTISSSAFDRTDALVSLTINNDEGSIDGAPWGADASTITWAGKSTATTTTTTTTTALATATSSAVLVNGEEVSFEAYNIDGSNYFKLRDIAAAITGSETQFDVTWDATIGINLISGDSYTAVGGELAAGDGTAKNYISCQSDIYMDGSLITLEAYTINNNNFFKLRDLGIAFDFNVSWDGTQNMITIDTTSSYEAD